MAMWKEPVRAGSTANLTLSGEQTIDGVAVVSGDRVLAKNQTAGLENGIYVAAAGAWSRSTDMDASAEVLAGLVVVITEGATQADTAWELTTNDPITLDTTALVFEPFAPNSLWKSPVRAATTANIALSGAQTIDGVSVVAGNRVLVKNQSTASQNGIYVATSGAWSRASDANTSAKMLSGTAVLVTEGTTNADTQWQLTTNDPITLASTSLTFELYPPVAAAKNPVRAATTGNITLSGAQTIDGVSVVAGDRVLVKNQTTGSENGIYVAAAGAWSRASDANSALKLLPASMVPVSEGTANANSVWWLTTAAPITLGSTSLTFGQFLYSFGSDTAMIFEYAVAAKVPTGGTRYFNSDGVPTNAPAQRIIRACRITGASIQVAAVDASRAYKLSILKNGVEAASVALSTSTLGNHSAALSVALAAGDLLSVALVRTSGTGISTFNAARALVELGAP